MGGGGYNTIPGKSIQDLMRQRDRKEEQQKYEQDVNKFLNSLLTGINERDIEQINTHLNTLREALEDTAEETMDLKYGGSISKHTYVNGLSDIDMLVQLNRSSLANEKVRDILKEFSQRIQKRLPKTKVEVGNLAVTVKFSSGHEIQLLPSIKTQTGNRIPKSGLNEWSNVTKPQNFAKKLTSVNQANGGKVVPVIKLFKSFNANLPETKQLSGYHIESLAINAFKGQQGLKTYKGMLKHFCSYSGKAIMNPIKDSTGQSVHVDAYLGSKNSDMRKNRKDALNKLERKLQSADDSASIVEWKNNFK